MKTREIYYSTLNPLRNTNTLNEIYYPNNESYCDKQEKFSFDDIDIEVCATKYESYEDSQKFYLMCFNIWKRKLLNCDNKKIKELFPDIEEGEITDFLLLLSKTKVTTKEEIIEFAKNIKSVFSQTLFSQLYFDQGSIVNGGSLEDSNHLIKSLDFKNDDFTIAINIATADLYGLLNLLITELYKRGLPYYIETTENYTIADRLKLHVDKRNIEDYINILYQIEARYGFSRNEKVGCPDQIAGVLDDWIGIYSTQAQGNDYKKTFMEFLNSKNIDDILMRSLYNYLKPFTDKKFYHNHMVMTLEEYIAYYLASDIYNSIDEKVDGQYIFSSCLERVKDWFIKIGLNTQEKNKATIEELGVSVHTTVGLKTFYITFRNIFDLFWGEGLIECYSQEVGKYFSSKGFDAEKICFSKEHAEYLKNRTKKKKLVVECCYEHDGWYISQKDAKYYEISRSQKTANPVLITNEELTEIEENYGADLIIAKDYRKISNLHITNLLANEKTTCFIDKKHARILYLSHLPFTIKSSETDEIEISTEQLNLLNETFEIIDEKMDANEVQKLIFKANKA